MVKVMEKGGDLLNIIFQEGERGVNIPNVGWNLDKLLRYHSVLRRIFALYQSQSNLTDQQIEELKTLTTELADMQTDFFPGTSYLLLDHAS
jgi:hypothetical protein